MANHDPKRDRTLQDDRAELETDPEDESPLVKGEGAPLAEDAVVEAGPEPGPEVTTPVPLGGAPMPVPTRADDSAAVTPAHAITAAGDKPIND
jgi:hypothetical protein